MDFLIGLFIVFIIFIILGIGIFINYGRSIDTKSAKPLTNKQFKKMKEFDDILNNEDEDK